MTMLNDDVDNGDNILIFKSGLDGNISWPVYRVDILVPTYGNCPEQSLWWEDDYDPPDYPMYTPNNTDDEFDWEKEV